VSTPSSHFAALGDLRLHYLDFGGSGSPVVLLHATGFHAWLWEPYARRLAATHRVLAVDQRGHGESDKPATGYRWEAFGADLAAFLDGLDLNGVVAVGHSKGATAIAAAPTNRIARAVLLEPVLFAGPTAAEPVWESPLAVGTRKRRATWPSREAMFASLRGKIPFEAWEEEFVRLYVEHGVRERSDGQVELLCPPEIEAQVYANAPMTDGFALLGRLSVPTLVVRGELSPGLSGDTARHAMARLARGELRVVAGAGHFAPMERSTVVADEIGRFLHP
jgi:pimeloyl-ACP methyl ester carboxylesterase